MIDSLAFPLRNKIIVITGANVGIGKSTAKLLSSIGARVIMGCRSLERANEAIKDIKEEFRSLNLSIEPQLEARELDLSDLNSIKRFSNALHDELDHIDVLINNAGVSEAYYKKTAQGFESMFGVNHVGHFYLTHLLLDLLSAANSARIVVVASDAHRFSSDFQNEINKVYEEGHYFGIKESLKLYGLTKGCNIMFTFRLHDYLREKGIQNVTVNCLHPGAVDTSLQRNSPRWLSILLKPIFYFFFKSPDEGATASVKLASSDELENVSGKYFDSNGNECEPKDFVKNPENIEWLWNYTKTLIRESIGEETFE